MKIQVLGASGGIGGPARTSALRVDDDILIDAGTGVGDLPLSALRAVDHVFLTHSHLDHVTSLPFLLDSVGADRDRPVSVHAQEATIAALREHLFNGVLWPDFSRIPTPQAPFLTYRPLPPGGETTLGERRLRGIPVNHILPAVGYLIQGPRGSLAFSGDTTVTDEFWRVLNACADLRYVIVETTFPDAEAELSRISKHLCPSMLVGELKKLKPGPAVYITHLMPGAEEKIMREIARHIPHNTPRRLMQGEVLEL
jgi:ribonuclease BN (tRNA processing enzyme)